MNIDKYQEMENLEKFHWWFLYRQKILRLCLKKYFSNLQKDALIVDIGCGTGKNLEILKENFTNVLGVDNNDLAIKFCEEKNLKVIKSELPDLSQIQDESVDLILLFDVLEHIENDEDTLNVLKSKLKKGGSLLLTVPAYKSLWSKHDEEFQHKRRYRRSEILNLLSANSFEIIKSSYLYFLLFPVVAIMRVLKKIFKFYAAKDDFKLNNKFLNLLLQKALMVEAAGFKFIDYPFGSSIIALAKK